MQEVWDEVYRHAPEALQDARLWRVSAATTMSPTVVAQNLDLGEAVTLSYALERRQQEPVLVLCDETAARQACRVLSLPVTGSVGLIAEACRAGRVDRQTATGALRDLPGRGRLHVRVELIEAVIAAL
ncbi:MAG: hypothetical protein HY320_06670 [Armatimonadetes bacterium]|nr:hypothetical protein [Armatimonadota bacterium]